MDTYNHILIEIDLSIYNVNKVLQIQYKLQIIKNLNRRNDHVLKHRLINEKTENKTISSTLFFEAL